MNIYIFDNLLTKDIKRERGGRNEKKRGGKRTFNSRKPSVVGPYFSNNGIISVKSSKVLSPLDTHTALKSFIFFKVSKDDKTSWGVLQSKRTRMLVADGHNNVASWRASGERTHLGDILNLTLKKKTFSNDFRYKQKIRKLCRFLTTCEKSTSKFFKWYLGKVLVSFLFFFHVSLCIW